MTQQREVIPPGSPEEAAITESVVLGLILGALEVLRTFPDNPVNLLGVHASRPIHPRHPNEKFSRVIVHMASGDYEVSVKKRG